MRTGRAEAEQGAHDDAVMAMAIAASVREQVAGRRSLQAAERHVSLRVANRTPREAAAARSGVQ